MCYIFVLFHIKVSNIFEINEKKIIKKIRSFIKIRNNEVIYNYFLTGNLVFTNLVFNLIEKLKYFY